MSEIKPESYTVAGIHVERYRPPQAALATPLICIHGGAHAAWCWRDTAPVYAARGFDVHALNWLGRGGSTPISDERLVQQSIADVVEDIAKVGRQFERPPILVAHSMGGLAAQLYALQHPVKALLLLTPVVGREIGAAAIELPLDMDRPWGPPPPELAQQLFFQGLDEAQTAACYALLVPESPRRVHEATRWTLSADPKALKAPMLVVSGDLDILTPASTGKALAEMAGVEHRLEAGFGHNVLMGAASQALARRLLPWLLEQA